MNTKWATHKQVHPLDATSFREAMSHVAAGVHLITTDGSAGKAGFTASAVCSVTDSPATLLVCIHRDASAYVSFQHNHVLCVNTLSQSQQALARLFASKSTMAERFSAGQWGQLFTGSPVLNTALVAFDCVIQQRQSVGSHDILICQVQAIQQGAAQPALVYVERQYSQAVPMTF